MARQIPSKSEYVWWPFITNRVDGFTRQLGTLEGLEDISPGRNLQFIPYAVGARSRFLSPPGYADLLFTYLLHPGTAVYLGYSDRRENLGLDGFRRPGPPNLDAGRQVFVKVSYLLRF